MGMTEDEMVGWHCWLNGHEFEQTPGVSDGQGSLACYSQWGRKELDTNERLNWTELRYLLKKNIVVQLLSRVQIFVTPWTAAWQASLSFTIAWSLLKLMSIESAMPSNHLILCHPRLLLPSISPSISVFSNVSVLCIRWPKYWSFSFTISPSKEYSGLISFRMDWLNLLAVQGTLKSLLQHYS